MAHSEVLKYSLRGWQVKLRQTHDLSLEQRDCVFIRKTESQVSRSHTGWWLPNDVRVYAIGDIHGRSDLLERQHALIEADFAANRVPKVHLVYLGDYIDRGPNSHAVLEILAQIQENIAQGPANDIVKITLLRGNHEEMLLRFLGDDLVGPSWCQLGGLETLRSYGIEVGKVLAESGYEGISARFKEKLPAHHLSF